MSTQQCHSHRDTCARDGDRSAHGKHSSILGLTHLSRTTIASSGSFHTSAILFLHTLREETLTNINRRDVVRMELHKHSMLWNFLLLFLTTDEHLQLQNVWTPPCPVTAQESSSQSAMPNPAHSWGPDGLSLPGRCCSRCQVPRSPAATLPAGTEKFISPSLFVQDLNVLILLVSSLPFFSSSAQSEFHYSLSSQCLTTSTFIHINSEWQSLTICWECWQQIVS